jgi:hypothetical protein
MTGLRVNEVRQLEWRDLHLTEDAPYIRLRAQTTKANRSDDVDLHPALAKALIDAKPHFARPTDRVFKSVPTLRTFKDDLKLAGIPYKDDEGRQVDRHALRNTFVSWLGAAGVDARIAQRLARHSTIELTTKTYQDKRMLAPNAQAAVQSLPNLFENPEQQETKATGTDDSVVPLVVLDVDTKGGTVASVGNAGDPTKTEVSGNDNDANPCNKDGLVTVDTILAAVGTPSEQEKNRPPICHKLTLDQKVLGSSPSRPVHKSNRIYVLNAPLPGWHCQVRRGGRRHVFQSQ